MPDPRLRRCGHCGRDGATAWAAGMPLCHTDDPARPDCYRRVTVYGEAPGVLKRPGGARCGVTGIVGIDATLSSADQAFRDLVALTEELRLYGDG